MTDHDGPLSRRTLLAAGIGAGVLAVAGCTHGRSRSVTDPDAQALEAARRSERLLLAAYADGTAGRTIHLAHLRALGDTSPPPPPGPDAGPATARPEGPTVAALLDAARNAGRGATAALLASIAGSHATLGGVPVP